MKASEIFNDCHGRYRGLREWLADATGAIHSLDLDKPSSGYLWRPDRARACDYVADFERIARHALRRPEWKGRLKLFNICFVHSVEYRRAVRMVGVSEGTFDYWYAEVKRAAGTEFARSELFPPWRYFLRRNQQPAPVSTSDSRPVLMQEPERKTEKKLHPRRARKLASAPANRAQETAKQGTGVPEKASGEIFSNLPVDLVSAESPA